MTFDQLARIVETHDMEAKSAFDGGRLHEAEWHKLTAALAREVMEYRE